MIYSIIVCAVFFAAVLMWLLRFLDGAGVKLPQGSAVAFITADKTYKSLGQSAEGRECVKIFIYAVLFRIAVLLMGWLACGIFSNSSVISFAEYLTKWNVWDGPHYIDIAAKGYAGHIEDGKYLFLVFFPLYPWLVRFAHFIIPNWTAAALTVSTLAYAAGCVLTYKLVTIDYSKSIAAGSIVLLSVYPFAFYYGAVMTESLFYMLITATFLAIRKHNWLLAGVLGALSALTRSFGVLMIIPAAAEWVQHNKPIELIADKKLRDLGKRFCKALPILIMPLGTLIYLLINYKVAGDPFIFSEYQSEHWSMNLQFFGKTLNMLWSRVTSAADSWELISCLFMPEVIALPIFAAVILYSIRRMRSMYSVFMLIYFAFNAAASWPLSLSRYLACMFPVFWLAAEVTDRHSRARLTVTAVMAVMFGIYMAGYVTMHQIM